MISEVRSNNQLPTEKPETDLSAKTDFEREVSFVSQTASFSFEKYQDDQVSISRFESHSSLTKFVSYMKAESGGVFLPDESDDYGGYSGMDSALGIAGKILSRIENLFFGKPASSEKDDQNNGKTEKGDTTAQNSPVIIQVPDEKEKITEGIPESPEAAVNQTGIPVEAEEESNETVEKTEVPLSSVLGFVETKFEQGFQNVLKTFSEPEEIEDLDEFNQTQSHIRKGMHDLKNRAHGENKHISRSLAASVGYMESNNLNLEIMTSDGDKINLIIGNTLKSGMALTADMNKNGFSFSGLQFGSVSENLQFSIEGDLDADEMKALADFLSDIGDLSETFFSSGGEEAFKQAMELGFSGDELASFSLDMSRTSSLYAEMSYVENNEDSSGAMKGKGKKGLLNHLNELGKRADKILNHPAKNFIHHPEKLIKNIFKEIADTHKEKGGLESNQETPDISEFSNSYLKHLVDMIIKNKDNPAPLPGDEPVEEMEPLSELVPEGEIN